MLKELGVGIDIADVADFKRIPYYSKPNFYTKIFVDSEIKYCLKFKSPYEHFAGKFAIKEAVKKSINEDIVMADIVTSHTNSKPKISLKGKLAKKYRFAVSLSHHKNMAIAIVLSEKI